MNNIPNIKIVMIKYLSNKSVNSIIISLLRNAGKNFSLLILRCMSIILTKLKSINMVIDLIQTNLSIHQISSNKQNKSTIRRMSY